MTDHEEKRRANALAQARSRVGTAHRLKAIEAKLEDLHADVQQVSALVQKATIQDNSYGD